MSAPQNGTWIHVGGVLGCITAAAVISVSMAMVTNDTAGKEVLPIF